MHFPRFSRISGVYILSESWKSSPPSWKNSPDFDKKTKKAPWNIEKPQKFENHPHCLKKIPTLLGGGIQKEYTPLKVHITLLQQWGPYCILPFFKHREALERFYLNSSKIRGNRTDLIYIYIHIHITPCIPPFNTPHTVSIYITL